MEHTLRAPTEAEMFALEENGVRWWEDRGELLVEDDPAHPNMPTFWLILNEDN